MTVISRWRRAAFGSVRSRLTAVGVATLLLALVVGALAFSQLFERQLVTDLDVSLANLANDRARSIDAGLDPVTQLETLQTETAVAVFDAEGELLANRGFIDPSQLSVVLPGAASTVTLDFFEPGENEVERSELRVYRAQPGSVSVVVAQELEVVGQTVNEARTLIAVGVPLMAFAGGALLWFVVGRALKPVDRMRRDAQSIVDFGDGQRVHDPESDDELGRLASTLNDMLGRLDANASAMRQFVSDSSHEIRSPIANIRVRIETAGEAEWEAVRADVVGEVERIETIIDDLTYLARSDEGQTGRVNGRVELDEIMFDAVERLQRTGGVEVDASAIEPVVVTGDRAQIERVIRNVMDNAARHADSTVRASLAVGGASAVINIDDDGPGIPPDDRARVFERFVRLDESRERSSGGTGLGLAIVDGIVADHEGSVSVESAPLGGARFRITLPLGP